MNYLPLSIRGLSGRLLLCLFFPLLVIACKEDIQIPDGAFGETTVDLQGTWKITRVFRNDVEMTEAFDFSGFELQLQMDGSGPSGFSVNNSGAPFVVLENGNWAYDDNTYPTAIVFTAGGDTETVFFAQPPISTGTTFSITFSVGCSDNSYTYVFAK